MKKLRIREALCLVFDFTWKRGEPPIKPSVLAVHASIGSLQRLLENFLERSEISIIIINYSLFFLLSNSNRRKSHFFLPLFVQSVVCFLTHQGL